MSPTPSRTRCTTRCTAPPTPERAPFTVTDVRTRARGSSAAAPRWPAPRSPPSWRSPSCRRRRGRAVPAERRPARDPAARTRITGPSASTRSARPSAPSRRALINVDDEPDRRRRDRRLPPPFDHLRRTRRLVGVAFVDPTRAPLDAGPRPDFEVLDAAAPTSHLAVFGRTARASPGPSTTVRAGRRGAGPNGREERRPRCPPASGRRVRPGGLPSGDASLLGTTDPHQP